MVHLSDPPRSSHRIERLEVYRLILHSVNCKILALHADYHTAIAAQISSYTYLMPY
jgi:hypothetical protein